MESETAGRIEGLVRVKWIFRMIYGIKTFIKQHCFAHKIIKSKFRVNRRSTLDDMERFGRHTRWHAHPR